jgi:LysM repeat protein
VVAGAALALAACGGSSSSHAAPKRPKRVVASTTTTAGPTTFTVKAGDTLTSIARFFGIAPGLIVSFNHLTNGDMLTVGQTLQIPPKAGLKLEITPAAAPAGEPFMFNLTGAKAMENVVFEITDPKGVKFKGAPHVAGDDGSVMAGYQSSISAAAGVYVIVATGDQGTSASASFRISASAPIS